jgi:hypothetical protein
VKLALVIIGAAALAYIAWRRFMAFIYDMPGVSDER